MAFKIQAIQGTYGWGRTKDEDQWWHPLSKFMAHLRTLGVEQIDPLNPWFWDTDLYVLPDFLRRTAKKHIDWEAWGASLASYNNNSLVSAWLKERIASDPVLEALIKAKIEAGASLDYVPMKDRNFLVHSHGLQPMLYACGKYNLKINSLVSYGSPVRQDMMDVAQLAKGNIGAWHCVYGDHQDFTQIVGAWFDGKAGVVRSHPLATSQQQIPVGHSDMLNDPDKFTLVETTSRILEFWQKMGAK